MIKLSKEDYEGIVEKAGASIEDAVLTLLAREGFTFKDEAEILRRVSKHTEGNETFLLLDGEVVTSFTVIN